MLTRRHFIAGSLVLGGAAIAAPFAIPLSGRTDDVPEPAYRKLHREGRLSPRIDELYQKLEDCQICPRRCGVNRLKGDRGFCRSPQQPVVYSSSPHFGEEHPLVGWNGSGTIFFSNCNLRCVFCQNWPIAHKGRGREVSYEQIASFMLKLQNLGCHNINLVTPTHVLPHILKALKIAMDRGLSLPLVYNTSGYESVEIIRLLDGIVDIYMPDFKFMDADMADTYSPGARDYPERTAESILEMHRQVGVLEIDSHNFPVARRGVLIRHLVMPNGVAGTRKFVAWVAENLPSDTYINIMAQYRVEHRAFEYPKIARGITPEEFLEAMDWADAHGLTNLDARSMLNRDRLRRRMS